MKIFIVFMLFVSALFADINVKDFFDKNSELSKKMKGNEATDVLLKEQISLNNVLINKIKSYENIEYNEINFSEYNAKIKINNTKNNLTAEYCDKLFTTSNEIETNAKNLFLSIQDLLKSETYKNKIQLNQYKDILNNYEKMFNQSVNYIQKDIVSFDKLYEELKKKETKIQIEIDYVKNYELFTGRVNTYSSIIQLLKDSSDIFINRYGNVYKLDMYIDSVNKSEYSSYINFYLSIINTDVGKLITGSLILILIHFFRKSFLYIFIYSIVKILKIDESTYKYQILRVVRKFLNIIFYMAMFQIFIHILFSSLELNKFDSILYSLYFIILGRSLHNALDIFTYEKLEYISTKYSKVRKELINLVIAVVKTIIMLIMVLLILVVNGVDIGAIVASLGIGGLAVAFAAKETLANAFASFAILMDNSFEQGDFITCGDVEGNVIEIKLRSTTLRTGENAFVTIPNSKLIGGAITNWSRRKVGRRIKMNIQVTYESNIENVMKSIQEIKEMLELHEGIAAENKEDGIELKKRGNKLLSVNDAQGVRKSLMVVLNSFENSGRDILISCFARSIDWDKWLLVKEDVLYKIEKILLKNNVELAYPTITNKIENKPVKKYFKYKKK